MLSHRADGRICAVLTVALLSVGVAHAADSDVRIDHLVVGDAYWTRVERHGVQQEIYGDLVKLTDRWVVLHQLAEGRNEHGVSVPASISFINPKLFKNIGVGRVEEYVWVPRDAFVIRGRLRATDSPSLEPPRDDEPILQTACEVRFVGTDKKVIERDGKLSKMSDDRLTISESEAFRVDVPKPGWSKLPWVGGYFVESRTETREKLTEISRGDIFCISVRVAQGGTPAPEKQVSTRQ